MNGAGNDAPPIQVQPSPLPMQWIIATAIGQRGEKMVVLQLLTPQGSSVFFLPAESAMALGEQIYSEGQTAGSGLVVPQVQPPADVLNFKSKPPGAR